jgi:hypothetical protein
MRYLLGLLALATLAAVALWAVRIEARRHLAARLAFIERFRFPLRLASETRERYPQLGPADLKRVEHALRQYFRLCARSRLKRVAMPSRVVDAMWHAWILDTRAYANFCKLAFGRFLHHTPAESMRSATEPTIGIHRAWQLACADEGMAARIPTRLPLLFALDGELGVPDGFRYAPNCRGVARSDGTGIIYCGSDAAGCGGGGGDGGSSADGCSGGDGGGCGGGGD